MAISKGRNLLLKAGTGTSAELVAAMRSTKFSINGELVDATTKDSGGMRVLLGDAGISKVTISANGLLSGNAQSVDFINKTLNRSLNSYRLEFDNGDIVEGSFQITAFEASGDYNGEQTYSMTLESSGSMIVTSV